jgi:hypothetical protein
MPRLKLTQWIIAMAIELSVVELSPPRLQFGGASVHTDPKIGLLAAGPFDLRFGSARKDHVHLGIVGPQVQIAACRRWLERCEKEIPSLSEASLLRKSFAGFEATFHKRLVVPADSALALDETAPNALENALQGDAYAAFQRVVDLYAESLSRLAAREHNRPDLVLVCIPASVFSKVGSVERKSTDEERQRAKLLQRRQDERQLDLFAVLDEVEQTPEDFLRRDLRHALKALALRNRLPIQLVTDSLLEDTARNQDPATRAWNFAVGIYYKAVAFRGGSRPAAPIPASSYQLSSLQNHASRYRAFPVWRKPSPAMAKVSLFVEKAFRWSPTKGETSIFLRTRRSTWGATSWRSTNFVLVHCP